MIRVSSVQQIIPLVMFQFMGFRDPLGKVLMILISTSAPAEQPGAVMMHFATVHMWEKYQPCLGLLLCSCVRNS